jgi:hypothetical protein
LDAVMEGQPVRRRSPDLTRVLVRALLVPVLVLVGVGGYLVAAALAANSDPGSFDSHSSAVTSPWKSGYSRHYPGCVASVLWPERETPAAVVVRWSSGRVERVATRRASQRLFAEVRTGEARIIGACYRR